MTVPVLVPLVGLPGVGKTSLARNLLNYDIDSEADDNDLVIFHLPFDEFLPQISSEDDVKTTKQFRKAAVFVIDLCLELSIDGDHVTAGALLSGLQRRVDSLDSSVSDAAKTIALKLTANRSDAPIREDTTVVFLLDDNNVYRSMRYEYYQLSRKHSVAFLQLFFDCAPSLAKSNDASRDAPHRVGGDVIDKMAAALEEPDPTAYRWERRSCRLLGSERSESFSTRQYETVDGNGDVIIGCSVRDFDAIIQRILFESQNPVKRSLIQLATDEQREMDRCINLQNVLHQCDVKLRSLVGQRIKALKIRGGDVKNEARNLSVIKASIFDRVKRGEIELDLDTLNSELEVLFLAEASREL